MVKESVPQYVAALIIERAAPLSHLNVIFRDLDNGKYTLPGGRVIDGKSPIDSLKVALNEQLFFSDGRGEMLARFREPRTFYGMLGIKEPPTAGVFSTPLQVYGSESSLTAQIYLMEASNGLLFDRVNINGIKGFPLIRASRSRNKKLDELSLRTCKDFSLEARRLGYELGDNEIADARASAFYGRLNQFFEDRYLLSPSEIMAIADDYKKKTEVLEAIRRGTRAHADDMEAQLKSLREKLEGNNKP